MRLWHFLTATILLAVCLTIARDEIGRVALSVFVTGAGVMVAGTSSILCLFRSLGAFGQARTFSEHALALWETSIILVIGSTVMASMIWLGMTSVQVVTAN